MTLQNADLYFTGIRRGDIEAPEFGMKRMVYGDNAAILQRIRGWQYHRLCRLNQKRSN